MRALNGPGSAKNALYFQPKLNDMVSNDALVRMGFGVGMGVDVSRHVLGPGRTTLAARCCDMPRSGCGDVV